MRKWLVIWGIGVMVVVAIVWTGNAAPTPIPAQPAPTLLPGSYETILSFNSEFGSDYSETWRLELDEKGFYRLLYFDTLQLTGRYKLKGEEIVFSDDTGQLPCIANGAKMQSGTYFWNYENNSLTLTEVQDVCSLRRQVLAAQPLITQ